MTAGFVANAVLEEIQRRVPIVEVVSHYVTLKRQGRNYVGLCPFHTEKTPSFSVSPEKGLFYCFGCGAGGNVFTFLMRIEGWDFRSAVERLAERAGVPLQSASRQGARTSERERAYAIYQIAAEAFRRCLAGTSGQLARAYLKHRGITLTAAETFGIGFCPSGAELQQALVREGVSVAEARRWGLLGEARDGRLYPRFAGRVMFPIRNLTGNVAGFAGRTIADQTPKYLNSPETDIFRKGEMLFGLFEARQAIRESGRVVVVEGYLDVVSLAQAGIREVVATMGTALTGAQLQLLRRFTDEVLVCFDGDDAGRRAAERAFIVAAQAGVWAKAVFLPQGEDPDSFVRSAGAEAVLAAFDRAVPLADFFFERKAPAPGASLARRARAVSEVADVLQTVEDPVLWELLVRRAAELLGVDEHLLRGRATRQAGQSALPPPVPVRAQQNARPEEVTLVQAIALSREAAEEVAAKNAWSLFASPDLASVAKQLAEAWSRAEDPLGVLHALPLEIQSAVAEYAVGRGPLAGANLVQVARDCMAKLLQRQRRRQFEVLTAELRAAERAGDAQQIAVLAERLRQLREQPEQA
jgi:DNA primase